MFPQKLRTAVLDANFELIKSGLVSFTFGNASGIDRESGLVAIKPSGVEYELMSAAELVVTDLDGNIVEGKLRPSSDLPTHLALYKAFPEIGGVAHTHSEYATAWAQAGMEIPCLGTTHADYFHGPVPLTEVLSEEELGVGYEANTGAAIVRRFAGLDYRKMPSVLVVNHGPFAWGKDPMAAAHQAAALEVIARMAYRARQLNPGVGPIATALHDRHFLRKHGATAYYGQERRSHP